jgi:dehydrogenase/reductase SDR family protein 4
MGTHIERKPPLEGKAAIVTASTDGIGLAIATRLATDGAKVMISSRKESNVRKVVSDLKEKGLSVEGTVCHVGKEDHRKNLIEETVKEFGGIDILISNAAANPAIGPVLQADGGVWDKIFDINVKSAALLVKEAHPYLKAKNNGSVVFVSSIGGYTPFQYLGIYSISKTALLGLTRTLAVELASDGIRVNCIAPGLIQTKFSSAIWKNESVLDSMEKTIPMRRIGQPGECAGMVSYLASDDSSYVTGETFVVAGGMQSRL